MNASWITGGPTERIFQARVLGTYDVEYHQCVETGFIQTDSPFWLEEAYREPITQLDVGYVERNIHLARQTQYAIFNAKQRFSSFIDYGGGYGLFVRLMRDAGYNFKYFDPHCINLFAREYSIDLKETDSFDLLTAFEVFEHLPNPAERLKEMISISKAVLFSTEILPTPRPKSADDWWYFSPQCGQHVSFYTIESLRTLAEMRNCHFATNGKNLHVFAKEKIDLALLRRNLRTRLSAGLHQFACIFERFSGIRQQSLVKADFVAVLNALDANR